MKRVLRVVGRSPDRARAIDPPLLLGALPTPVVLLDAENRFKYVNHAAEQFLGLSSSQLSQLALSDLVPEDSPIFLLIEQVRNGDATISDYDLHLDSARMRKRGITVQGTPLPEEPDASC